MCKIEIFFGSQEKQLACFAEKRKARKQIKQTPKVNKKYFYELSKRLFFSVYELVIFLHPVAFFLHLATGEHFIKN